VLIVEILFVFSCIDFQLKMEINFKISKPLAINDWQHDAAIQITVAFMTNIPAAGHK